ncbi:NADPH-dependent FMN reductase [Reichenbachiella sp. MSK19-1]|uniref:NADPH-dependent FMN reductase n=1 Tax=Reichenbachiella sp. MSK19-1 TaxID=1897631 RepID=UPI000E6BA9CF|nr:NAD(P)H-dependent oxidoreductase [Reichenbachiella sp. MSK19-1]RJE72051.1 NADPH-dependent FMN reductase [Reichenbachiella sp. MSK19-1]
MKKILAFAGSNSSQSINRRLVRWASDQVAESEVTLLDLNDFEMPIFSEDREREKGIPSEAKAFKNTLRESDAVMISFAEHNGNFSAAFKNIFDWASRIEAKIWLDKPMFLMATSNGKRGGSSVLEIAVKGFPFRGGEVVAHFSLPSFSENFSDENGILDEELRKEFVKQLELFDSALAGD